MTNNNLIN